MTRAQKSQLEKLLLEAFLFAFFRSTSTSLQNGRRYLTSGNLQVIDSQFIGWSRELNDAMRADERTEIRDALLAIYPNPSGRSEKLAARIGQDATFPRGLIAPLDIEIPDIGNPMLGPELTGGVTKENVRVILARLSEPWRL